MKAFLLAAGNGTRLRPLTNNVPKCMVPIQGTPLLGIWLEWCLHYGIDEVLINVHAHADAVVRYLATDFGVKVVISYEEQLLGSAGTLLANRHFVKGAREFAVLYADVLTNCNFYGMLDFHRRHQSPATLGLYSVPNPSQCGIAAVDARGRIVDFEEKPSSPQGDLAFSGVMIGTPVVMEELNDKVPSDIGSDLLPRLVGRMYGYRVSDYLIDIGSHSKYRQAQQEWTGLNIISHRTDSSQPSD